MLRVRVRPITLDEARALGPDDVIYVADSGFTLTVLVPAHLRADGVFESEGFSPRVGLRTIYGSEGLYALDLVFVADGNGDEALLMATAGTRISSSLFFLGLEEGEAVERLKEVLRKEFGPGVVEVWNLRSTPVRDVLWDVWEVRRELLPAGPKPKKGKAPTAWQEVERRLIARGIRDGHQRYFMGKETPGWSLVIEGHQPEGQTTEIL